jgi:Tol biopolymer transport system component
MQADTVTPRLSISPQVEGTFSWQGATLRFQPQEDWPEGAKVRITLVSGAMTDLGVAIDQAYASSFTVRAIQLAFLYPANGSADLYLLDTESGISRQVTEIGSIQDFDLLPASDTVLFTALNSNEGSDIYRLELTSGEVSRLLDCENEYCSMVRVSPDGAQLAYERSGLDGRVSIWLTDITGRDQQMVSRPGHEARLPQWSPEGLLSYYDVDDEAYSIHDLDRDGRIELENLSGQSGSWSPTGQRFAVQQLTPYTIELPVDLIDKPFEVIPEGEEYEAVEVASGNIITFSYDTQTSSNLSGRSDVVDANPVYSPDGRWLVFARRVLDPQASMLGGQVWLMRANGSQQRALTDNPNYKYSGFAWHPDNRQIAVVRADNTQPTELPELWLLDVTSGSQARLVIGGYDPVWIP